MKYISELFLLVYSIIHSLTGVYDAEKLVRYAVLVTGIMNPSDWLEHLPGTVKAQHKIT